MNWSELVSQIVVTFCMHINKYAHIHDIDRATIVQRPCVACARVCVSVSRRCQLELRFQQRNESLKPNCDGKLHYSHAHTNISTCPHRIVEVLKHICHTLCQLPFEPFLGIVIRVLEGQGSESAQARILHGRLITHAFIRTSRCNIARMYSMCDAELNSYTQNGPQNNCRGG